MAWLPIKRLPVGPLVATPPERVAGPPRFVPSIVNWTVPVGVPLPLLAVTVAVEVTVWPHTEGFTEARAVALLRAADWELTTWPPVRVPVPVVKLPSPL